MKILRLILLNLFVFSAAVHSAAELDFSQKRNYFLGEGEFGSVTLQLKSAETFSFEPGISRPFVLKKLNNTGLIEIIFDSRTMDPAELTEGKSYTTQFVFTKVNIGKKELLNVSAIYRPELRLVVNDSLFSDFTRLNFTPDNRTFVIKLNALKNIKNLTIEDPKGLLRFGSDNRLSVSKGINEIEVTLNKEENFSEEIMVYRKLSEGKINQLYFIATAKDFKTVKVDAEIEDVSEEEIRQMMVEDSLEKAGLYSAMQETEDQNIGTASSGGGFSTLSLAVIGALSLLVIVLLIMMALKKKDPLFETYQTFFDDVATLVNVKTKGTNLTKSIEEIMMILLERFEYGSTPEAKKQTETKRVLKKPAGIKTPETQKPDEVSLNIDLDLGAGKEHSPQKTETPAAPKPGTGEKKISRGFDFLEED